METNVTELTAAEAGLLDLGEVLGQHRTLAVVAGWSTAAKAATLTQLREEKLYKRCTPYWAEFCTRHLKISRAEADKTIRLWQEFGPGYFEVSQLTRISAETYRAIAPSVKDGSLHHNGEAIPLTPENAQRVAAGIADMRSALSPPAKADHTATAVERVAALDRRCTEVTGEFDRLMREAQAEDCRGELGSVLRKWRSELQRIALENGIE
jgi:hypothetical protein